MLDTFLKVSYAKEARQSRRNEMAEAMQALPVDELKKLASGQTKLAYLGDPKSGGGSWLDQFQGTPLYDEALSLEEKELQVEAEDIQNRQEDRARRDPIWEERDAIALKKRLLELKLRQDERGGGAEPMEEELEEEPAMEEAPEEPVEEKAASALDEFAKLGQDMRIESMRKMAFSVTSKGHEQDARVLRHREQAALKHLAMLQDEGVAGYKDDQGKLQTGSLRAAFSVPYGDASIDDHRHLNYAAKKHEQGRNAWNPFGGTLTPHPAESKGATRLSIGRVKDPEKKASVDHEVTASMRKTALRVRDKKTGKQIYDSAPMDAKTKKVMKREFGQAGALRGGGAGAVLGAIPGALGGLLTKDPSLALRAGAMGGGLGALAGGVHGYQKGSRLGEQAGEGVNRMRNTVLMQAGQIGQLRKNQAPPVEGDSEKKASVDLETTASMKMAALLEKSAFVPAVAGAMKARKAGESGLEGAVLGTGGATLGGTAGGALGALAGKTLSRHPMGAAVGALAGSVPGAVLGYKKLTSKYNQPKTASAAELPDTPTQAADMWGRKMAHMEKESNIGAAMMSGLKGMASFGGQAAKGLGTAIKSGNTGQMLQSGKNIAGLGAQQAGQFAKKNPLAAAGLGAGAMGTAALGGAAAS